jgi:hypothetical protein
MQLVRPFRCCDRCDMSRHNQSCRQLNSLWKYGCLLVHQRPCLFLQIIAIVLHLQNHGFGRDIGGDICSGVCGGRGGRCKLRGCQSVCAPDAPVLYDLSHRSRMGRYPRPRCPIWIPPLSIPTGLRGEVGRDSCIRAIVQRAEESLHHRLFARVVCLLRCHALF